MHVLDVKNAQKLENHHDLASVSDINAAESVNWVAMTHGWYSARQVLSHISIHIFRTNNDDIRNRWIILILEHVLMLVGTACVIANVCPAMCDECK